MWEAYLRIRPAQLTDAQAIADLENSAYDAFDPDLKMEGRTIQTGDRLRATMAARNEVGVVAEDDTGPDRSQDLIGVALWRPAGDPVSVSHLHLLFINPNLNRQGLGSRLIRIHWKESLARWPALQVFTLNVLKDSYWAPPFYAKHGYHIYQPGDERAVPALGDYFAAPPPAGLTAQPPYFLLHYLPASQLTLDGDPVGP